MALILFCLSKDTLGITQFVFSLSEINRPTPSLIDNTLKVCK